jgi:hypothetical protein
MTWSIVVIVIVIVREDDMTDDKIARMEWSVLKLSWFCFMELKEANK